MCFILKIISNQSLLVIPKYIYEYAVHIPSFILLNLHFTFIVVAIGIFILTHPITRELKLCFLNKKVVPELE